MKFSKLNETLQKKWLYILAYFYLFSSVAIFLLGNVKYIISIPLTILLLIANVKAIQNAPEMKVSLFKGSKKFIFILIIILMWVVFAGVGGFIWQNPWDHKFRNAVFKDLVGKSWPVISGSKALCYYLGFWLPSALVGKLFGLHSGYFFQIVWAFLGIAIAFGIVCQYLKEIKIRNILIFIFYSGLDVFLFLMFSGLPVFESINNILGGSHLELSLYWFNSSSNTTLLFWLYNQIIPFWVGMMLLLSQKNSKSICLIYAMLFLYSPFPDVALAPVMVYLVFRQPEKNILKKILYACSFENIVAIPILIILALFMKSNDSAGNIGILLPSGTLFIEYLCYIIFEFLVYLIFVYRKNKNDAILNILIIVSAILPFITMGNSFDFAARTSIPLAFYIMLLVMKEFQDKSTSKKIKIGLIIVLCLGSVTPMTEMIRTFNNEKGVLRHEYSSRADSLDSVFTKNECYTNFVADTSSIFFKYLAK